MEQKEIEALLSVLKEIRDLQRAHVEEYQRVTGLSLGLQEQAAARQRQFAALYRWVLLAGGVLVLLVLALIAYLLRFL